MHFLLALKIPASIQGRSSIAKGQYRISNTGKIIASGYYVLSVKYYLEKQEKFWIFESKNN